MKNWLIEVQTVEKDYCGEDEMVYHAVVSQEQEPSAKQIDVLMRRLGVPQHARVEEVIVNEADLSVEGKELAL